MEISLNTQVQILLIELCFKSRSRLSPLFEGNTKSLYDITMASDFD